MDAFFELCGGGLSPEERETLRGKKVLIAGCGGIGAYLAEYLLRLGVGRILAADPDRFDESNFNRQLYCTDASLGSFKAETAARRAEELGRGASLQGLVCRLDADNLPSLLQGCDAVLDALDSAEARRVLKAACDRQGVPYLFGAVNGWTAQAALLLPGDGALELLFPRDYRSDSGTNLSFTPALCAALQAALCTALLCAREVKAGVLYSMDLARMDFGSLRL